MVGLVEQVLATVEAVVGLHSASTAPVLLLLWGSPVLPFPLITLVGLAASPSWIPVSATTRRRRGDERFWSSLALVHPDDVYAACFRARGGGTRTLVDADDLKPKAFAIRGSTLSSCELRGRTTVALVMMAASESDMADRRGPSMVRSAMADGETLPWEASASERLFEDRL